MPESQTLILNHHDILIKLDRMACEICEANSEAKRLIICGLNERGYFLAEALSQRMNEILPDLQTELCQVEAHASQPVFSPMPGFKGASVLVVDDVINTGSTLMKVLQEIYKGGPECIQTAFLAKREHRSFPVKADFVGISLATTLQEHVHFDKSDPGALNVYLN